MDFVFKIKYGNVLRRLDVERVQRPWLCERHGVTATSESSICPPLRPGDTIDLTYAGLEKKIRSLFGIPSSSEMIITYEDNDKDIITVSGIRDVEAALAIKSLIPLRLHLRTVYEIICNEEGQRTRADISAAANNVLSSQSMDDVLISGSFMKASKTSGLKKNSSFKNECTFKILQNGAKEILIYLSSRPAAADTELLQKRDDDNDSSPDPKSSHVVDQLRHKLHEVIDLMDLL